jgi:hypothetical protein
MINMKGLSNCFDRPLNNKKGWIALNAAEHLEGEVHFEDIILIGTPVHELGISNVSDIHNLIARFDP